MLKLVNAVEEGGVLMTGHRVADDGDGRGNPDSSFAELVTTVHPRDEVGSGVNPAPDLYQDALRR